MKRTAPIIFIFLGISAGLLVGELVLRLSLPRSHWEFWDAADDWKSDDELGWVNSPSIRITTQSSFGWEVNFETNPDGILPQHAKRPRNRSITRIILMGDSTTLGRAVPEDKRLHSVLQKIFAREGRQVEVLNAAVQGYATDQSLLLMKRLLPLYNPDIVIYTFCLNDLSDNHLSTAFGSPKPRFVQQENGLQYIPAAMNLNKKLVCGPQGLSRWLRFSALYQYVRPHYFRLCRKLGIGTEPLWQPEMSEVFSKIGADPRWQLLGSLLTEMQNVAKLHHARFLLYAHPDVSEVWKPAIDWAIEQYNRTPLQYDRFVFEKKLQSIAASNQIKFCPHVAHFTANEQKGPFHLLPRDPHCNAVGYALSADLLHRCLSTAFH
ncbi:MAG: SGNH/GDSL hydrolase family protein [Deltaproteobacteria bacterium]|nr:SGNH/GDSL hydrolase family protein [Deltaproteobacteria bacterium]